MHIAEAQSLWHPQPGWLNTASYGLPPDPAWVALQHALSRWRAGAQSWEEWDESTDRSRAAFARLVNVEPPAVSVGSNVSGLLGPIAASLPGGSRVVVPEVEFTSNLFPWLAHQDRGVEALTVPPEKLVDAIDESTTLVAVSAVQSATGEVADLDAVVAAARAVDALVVVDGTQAVGWLPVDASQVDALACAGYKWLMGPRGSAFLTVSDRMRERVRPLNAGWYAGADVHGAYYGPPLRLADDARRLDVSPAWFSWVGTAPALEVVEKIGVDRIRDHDVALANRFREGLGMPASDTAIVAATLPGAEEKLARAGIRAASRAGSLRASFHLYNTEADVDTALEALA